MGIYQGTSGNDSLVGGNGDDTLNGGAGNDTLRGGGGNDVLNGGAGADLLDGGDGDDSFSANDDSGPDTLIGGNGNDTFNLNYNFPASYPGSSAVKIDAGAGDDLITLSFAQWAMIRPPDVTGGSGVDTYAVGFAASYIAMTITDFAAGAGGDRIDLSMAYRESISDYNRYHGGNPFATGQLKLVQVGNDTQVQGLGYYDTALQTIFILKNVSASSLTSANFAGAWNPNGAAVKGQVVDANYNYASTFWGGSFNDTINGNSYNNELHGRGGDDVLNGGGGNEQLFGGYGNDTLSGGLGDDRLYGDAGDNLLDGGDGNDRLYHTDYAAGKDTMLGGAGDDVFIYSSSVGGEAQASGGAGRDTYTPSGSNTLPANLNVMDFTVGANGDLIDVMSQLYSVTPYRDGNPFSVENGYVRVVQDGADSKIQIDRDGAGGQYGFATVLTLKNVDAGTLTPDNFVGGLKTDGSAVIGVIATADQRELYGTSFNDQLSATFGTHQLYGRGGDDLLQAGAGDSRGYGDYLGGGSGNDTLVGGAAADQLYGEEGNDTLTGGAGDDSLDGGLGNDLLRGGAGNDTLFFIDGGFDTLDGGDGDDNFFYRGIGGKAVAIGGGGRDIYRPEAERYNAFGNYVLSVGDFASGAGGDQVDLTTILGVTDYTGGNPFSAELGYARLTQSGADTLVQIKVGGAASANGAFYTVLTLQNTNKASLTADNFVGGLKPDGGGIVGVNLTTSDGVHVLTGGSYDDTLTAVDGTNFLSGNGGSDLLQAGRGSDDGRGDALNGGAGNDTLRGGVANDDLRGGEGDDQLQGGAGDDTLDGDAGNDLLQGGDGNDRFYIGISASGDKDTLDGGDGDDQFGYGPGTNSQVTATGGAGRDVYKPYGEGYYLRYEQGLKYNFSVTDFTAGAGGDKIDLMAAIISMTDYSGGNPFAAGHAYARLLQSGADTLVQFSYFGNNNGSNTYATVLTLKNLLAGSLTADNFVDALKPDGGAVSAAPVAATQANVTLSGGYLNDTLTALSGQNRLDGNGGDDLLQAGAGDAEGHGDVLNGGAGNDTLSGGAGNDVLYGDGGRNLLQGGDGNDTLYSTYGGLDDTLDGGTGDDRFELGASQPSHVTMASGGGGNDSFHVVLNHEGLNARISGGDGRDTYIIFTNYYGLDGYVEVSDFTAGNGGDVLNVTELMQYADNYGYSGGNPLNTDAGYLQLVQSGADLLLRFNPWGAAGGAANTVAVLRNVSLAALTEQNMIGANPKGDIVPGQLLEGTLGAEALWGGRFNDTIHGNGGHDTLDGGDGNDLIEAGDVVAGTDEGGHLSGGNGNDTLIAGNGDDTLVGGAGDNQLSGGAGKDQLYLFGSNDSVNGGDGDDTIYAQGDAGSSTIQGGAGDDTLKIYAEATPGITLRFDGGAGDDRIEVYHPAGAGKLTATGGQGSDTYYFGNMEASNNYHITDFAIGAGGDRLDINTALRQEGLNTKALLDPMAYGYIKLVQQGTAVLVQFDADGAAGATYVPRTIVTLDNLKASNLGNAIFAGQSVSGWADETVYGGLGNDSLQGGYLSNRMESGAGDDTLDGAGGADDMIGGAGNDLYLVDDVDDAVTELANGGIDTVRTTVDKYTLTSNIEVLQYTGASDFHGIGNASGNIITGGAGNDTLDGNGGGDILTGLEGDDTYIARSADDRVIEAADGGYDLVQITFAGGAYTLTANVEDATLMTSAATITLTGNAQDNYLTGNAGANTLNGGAGDDTLDGGAGADKLAGGAGDDLFIVDNAGDVVSDLLNEGRDAVQTTLAKYTLTANVEDLLYTGGANFAGTGNTLNNRIQGGNGGDTLSGGAGDDTLSGMGGADTIDGGVGDDVLEVLGDSDHYLISRAGDKVLMVNTITGERLTLSGIETVVFLDGIKSMADLLLNKVSDGDDYLKGTDGDDTIDGLAGADDMTGGLGDDTYVVDNLGDRVNEAANQGTDTVNVALKAAGTYVLGANIENATVTAAATLAINLTGNDLANTLIGNAAANTLTGGAGDDTLDGGAGSDKLTGGDGDDVYKVDAAGDIVTELANQGTDRVETALATYKLTVNVENLLYTGATAFNGTGNELANVITGGNGNDSLSGLAGNDTLTGGVGNDTLLGGDGDDLLNAGKAGVSAATAIADLIDGGAGDDTVTMLGNFADYTRSRPNAIDTVLVNSVTGEKLTLRNVEHVVFADGGKLMTDVQFNLKSLGNDSLGGSDGDDTLDGGLGADTLTGLLGDDTYIVDDIGDTIIEAVNGGTDQVNVALSKAGTYVIGANVENATITAAASIAADLTGNDLGNLLTGNAAANKLIGGIGNDTLDGGAGNDTLDGGIGNDTLDGGAGADKLLGGDGDDVYKVDAAGDIVTELANQGTDRVETAMATYKLTANVEGLLYTGATAFNGIGNELANVITGGSGNDSLSGQAGNDTLTGGLGNDTLLGGDGDDLLSAGKAGVSAANAIADLIDGGAGNDTVIVLGNFADYARSRPNATDTVLFNALTGEKLTLRNVENIVFADGLKPMSDVQFNIKSIGNDNLGGTAGKDTLDGGLGADTLTGLLGDDTYLIDDTGDTVIEAVDGGTDQVNIAFTKAGTHVMGANVENATVTGAASISVNITGNDLDNQLTGNAAANVLTGGAGNDTLGGGDGNDTLDGGIGNDTLDGGAGADKLLGGDGDDVYKVDAAGDIVTELANQGTDRVETTLATYKLTANVENLLYTGATAFNGSGNELANIITGGNGNDSLSGLAGNDTLTGGLGNDTLLGGDGDDLLNAGKAGVSAANAIADLIDGGAGNDTVTVLGNFADYARSRPNATDTLLVNAVTGEKLTLRNVENIVFADGAKPMSDVQYNIKSIGNDHLGGTVGNDTLDGGLGADILTGLLGDDTYIVDDIGDTIIEANAGGIDQVIVALTKAGTYVIGANVENATITAGASIAVNLTGNDLDNLLTGNAASNTLIGGIGNDTLDGGAGADKLIGGSGDDSYLVDNTSDVITELAGGGHDLVTVKTTASYTLSAEVEDLIFSGATAFTGTGNALANSLTGGNGADILNGLDGNDALSGGAGADKLLGGEGDDNLTGGDGNDTITGGAGADTIVLDSRVGVDTLTDFVSGTDKLALSQAVFAIGLDKVIDNAVIQSVGGGFAANAELVILTQNVAGATTAAAATAIGSAAGAYAVGDKALFALHSGSTTTLYLFTSSGADATVSAPELTQIATLTGTPTTAIGDYLFV